MHVVNSDVADVVDIKSAAFHGCESRTGNLADSNTQLDGCHASVSSESSVSSSQSIVLPTDYAQSEVRNAGPVLRSSAQSFRPAPPGRGAVAGPCRSRGKRPAVGKLHGQASSVVEGGSPRSQQSSRQPAKGKIRLRAAAASFRPSPRKVQSSSPCCPPSESGPRLTPTSWCQQTASVVDLDVLLNHRQVSPGAIASQDEVNITF